MVRQQVRCWDVPDPRVLDALENVPREHFVPEEYADLAFADVMLPLGKDATGHERMMLKPNLQGRILQDLNIEPTDCALVIGTGSGYLTACIARLTRHVTSIDLSPDMVDQARQRLDDLDITNVDLQVRNMADQPTTTKFDVIIVTGSLPVYDSRIDSLLKPGGRAFVVIGTAPAMEVRLIECSNENEISYRSLFETVIPPLTISESVEHFEF
ncbi:MAG: protein-L-isoaspartate O-methyltransferase [Gammaproteobacteria bacterium]|nr:protein-L-isoaspartate O-methyltransferase [Gammaproteobacteria bacterium]